MAAGKLNLPTIEKGATYRHALNWTDSEKVPRDLTGCTARMQVRESLSSSIVLLELTTENDGIIIDPLIGKISLFVAPDDTTALVGVGGVYDLEVIFSADEITRLCEGKILFKDEVTR